MRFFISRLECVQNMFATGDFAKMYLVVLWILYDFTEKTGGRKALLKFDRKKIV